MSFLEVRSEIDPAQHFLLPLPSPPEIDGLAVPTRLGRLHALYWSLAFGTGTLSKGSLVRFQTDGIRYRRTVDVAPNQLGEQCWVAEAQGAFSTAATVAAEIETARVHLADRW